MRFKFGENCVCIGEQGSSVGVVSGYRLDGPAIEVRFPETKRIFSLTSVSRRSRGSSVSIVSGYGLDGPAIEVWFPEETKRIFPVSSVTRPTLRPTQPPVQWVPGVLSPGAKRGRGVTLTTHPHLVPRSWMRGRCDEAVRVDMERLLATRHWKTAARNREEWREKCGEARARIGL
jgi:hypothetical protein